MAIWRPWVKPGGISEESIAKISSTFVSAAIFTPLNYRVRPYLSFFADFYDFLVFQFGTFGATTELGGYHIRGMSAN